MRRTAFLLLVVTGVLIYFFYQTATLRTRLTAAKREVAEIRRDLAATEALLERRPPPVPAQAADHAVTYSSPSASLSAMPGTIRLPSSVTSSNTTSGFCPVITLVERACPAPVRATLAEVEREFGLGPLDCRTLPR